MKYPRANDDSKRQGNLVLLKAWDADTREKGVLYLQYTESIPSFVSLFDLDRLARNYRLVLEPSTWGYQDVNFLLLIGKEMDVIVQAQDDLDFQIISALKSNLVPIRLGAGDWVDPDLFHGETGDAKEYDFVMVASWSTLKRHRLFFRALAQAGLQSAAVALVGYAWEGRTRSDIEREARDAGLKNVRIFERIPRSQVAQVIAQSRAGVMLSKREGSNRGIYECLLSDVPVVLTGANRGVNRDLINTQTGTIASDVELPQALRITLDEHRRFTPRKWALANTGCHRAWRMLNDRVKELAAHSGEPFTRDIARMHSSPAITYIDDDARKALCDEYSRLVGFLR